MYVYLIFDKSSKLFKIGKSKNPAQRIAMLSTANPNLNLLFYTDKFSEKDLHIKYSNFKVSGEWYKLTRKHLVEIMGCNSNIPKTFFYRSTESKIKSKTYTDASSVSITTTFDFKYQIKAMPEYKFAKKKLFNVHRGKEIKKVLNGYTIGYNLRGKFYSMQRIKTMIEPVEKNICPF